MLGKFQKASNSARESQFWQWFAANEHHIYSFESNQEAVLDQIESRLKQVNRDLCFAIGMIGEDGRREFEISAGGIKTAFPAVESLHRAAPDLPRWIWIKYRARMERMFNVEFGGKTVRADDTRFLIMPQGRIVNVVLFFSDYTAAQRKAFGEVGFLYLDNLLGEYSVTMQVGTVEFTGHDSKLFGLSHPMSELAAQFDTHITTNGG
jgi:hypothetical protein